MGIPLEKPDCVAIQDVFFDLVLDHLVQGLAGQCSRTLKIPGKKKQPIFAPQEFAQNGTSKSVSFRFTFCIRYVHVL